LEENKQNDHSGFLIAEPLPTKGLHRAEQLKMPSSIADRWLTELGERLVNRLMLATPGLAGSLDGAAAGR
jgi:hypothetical protein